MHSAEIHIYSLFTQTIYLQPTSGLDSYQAQQVVNTLRKLADSGKTVIAVIHQPSQKVFSTFDDLLLISDGRQMYFGEVRYCNISNGNKYLFIVFQVPNQHFMGHSSMMPFIILRRLAKCARTSII